MPATKLIGPLRLHPVTKKTPIGSILGYKTQWDSQNTIEDNKIYKISTNKFLLIRHHKARSRYYCEVKMINSDNKILPYYLDRTRASLCVLQYPSLDERINQL